MPDNQYRTRCTPHDFIAYIAEYGLNNPSVPVRSQDDEVGRVLLGHLHNGVGRFAAGDGRVPRPGECAWDQLP